MYNPLFGSDIQISYIIQTFSERPSNDTAIPLNILLDTFKLPQRVQTTCSEQSKYQKKFPTRRTQRKCKPTSTLQEDPQQTS